MRSSRMFSGMPGVWGVFTFLLGLCVQSAGSRVPAAAKSVAPCCMMKGVTKGASSSERPACDGPYGLPGSSLPPDQVGAWGPVVPWPIKATHAVLLHTGKILFWRESAQQFGLPTTTYVWDPGTDQIENMLTPATELFCSGHAQLADGRILAGGGTTLSGNAYGSTGTNIFDPQSETWTRVADMHYGRWYATLTPLADGRVVAMAGTINPQTNADTPEIYDPRADTWTELEYATRWMPNYPQAMVLSDGHIFYGGPDKYSQVLDANADTLISGPVSYYDNYLGSAVQYAPGKMMRHGGGPPLDPVPMGNKTQIIDMYAPSPAWTETPSGAYSRGWLNLVQLPDGKVLAVGGAAGGNGWYPECGVHASEMWDPITTSWSVMVSQQRPREYHSIGLLLPDGRVLSAGGENLDIGGEFNREIYSPPYLFKGARPTIEWAPGAIGYGGTFKVFVGGTGSNISSVALIRNSSVTHAFDQGQRYLPLPFSRNGSTLTVTAPAQANMAPPGYYMLFVVDSSGVPSIASFTLMGSCTAKEDSEISCTNGMDDDCDGLPDQADPNCGSPPLPFSPVGAVPDGGARPGEPLKIDKVPGDMLRLTWGAPPCCGNCPVEPLDYAVYEGTLGDWGSHVPIFCSTNWETTRTFGRGGDTYYLVVPHNELREGSYGFDSQGNERAQSSGACRPQEVQVCGPEAR